MFQRFKQSYGNKFKKTCHFVATYFKHYDLWSIHKESIARGVGIGLFVAFVPIMPFQTLMAILLSILLRANFAVAFAVSWISNPLTLLPLTYFTYQMGHWVIGEPLHTLTIHTFSWGDQKDFWSSLSAWLQQFGKAFFVGMSIISLSAALIGYAVVRFLWHLFPYADKNQ